MESHGFSHISGRVLVCCTRSSSCYCTATVNALQAELSAFPLTSGIAQAVNRKQPCLFFLYWGKLNKTLVRWRATKLVRIFKLFRKLLIKKRDSENV